MGSDNKKVRVLEGQNSVIVPIGYSFEVKVRSTVLNMGVGGVQGQGTKNVEEFTGKSINKED